MKSNNNRETKIQRLTMPNNDKPKPMDSKSEVEQSNDEKIDQDFPGYPHYPAREDIMDQRTGSHKVDMNLEDLASARNTTGLSQRFFSAQEAQRKPATENQQSNEETNDDLNLRPGTDADVDDDDLAVLNSTNDEIGVPQNVSNENEDIDLDIPGSELDDKNEEVGEEDEENNYYSLGGERHQDQEEDPYSGPERGNV